MTSHSRDVFDALREHDPALASSAELDAVVRQAVKTRVLASQVRPRRSSRRKIILAVALIALLLAVTAAAVVLGREPTAMGIACFQNPELGGAIWGVVPQQSLHPSECEPLWREGRISNPDFGPRGEVPPLVGCVSDSGALWVFPGDDDQLCEHLELARYTQPARNEGVELMNELDGLFTGATCVPIPDAEVRIQAILNDRGLDDWSVNVTSPASPERPCASLHFDGAGRVINLVPLPRLSDG